MEVVIVPTRTILVKHLGLVDYVSTWQAMQDFTSQRDPQSDDEIWLLEHPPVYTQGLAGKPEHLLTATSIPVIKTDRGGQITYHGPGQLVAYVLYDLKRAGMSVRELVRRIEQALIDVLQDYGITASRKTSAPGVYVHGAKIAALGLRVRRGCSYHGLSFNVAMDLAPFSAINPCGYAGLEVTDLARLGVRASMSKVTNALTNQLITQLSN